jgi:hypothetical protein
MSASEKRPTLPERPGWVQSDREPTVAATSASAPTGPIVGAGAPINAVEKRLVIAVEV